MMRQRLVGTLVLLCGGVILWTALFTGPAEYKLDRDSQLPPAPEITPVIALQPQRPIGVPSANEVWVPPQKNLPVSDRVEKPAAKPRAEKKPVAVAAVPEKQVAKPKPKPKPKATPKPKTVEKPALDKKGLPTAWVVQVGSFSKKANANTLKNRLQKAGYKAYVQQGKNTRGVLYRVLVGPLLSKPLALEQQAKINKSFKLKSLVNRFEP